MTEHVEMCIADILRLLPHRYPFLLVDRVTEYSLERGEICAFKNVTFNEPFFSGHFPDKPVMPGVLILEAMAQTAGLLAARSAGMTVNDGLLLYFAGIDKARFKRPVVPGDRLDMRARLLKNKRSIWKFDVQARVGNELACQAEMMCALVHNGGADAAE